MAVAKLINEPQGERQFSFEVLPPLKGTGTEGLFRDIAKLCELQPAFINITTHHSEYVYRELPDGKFERLRQRRRPGTIAVAAANGLAMLRVLTGISLLYFVIPGYVLALGMSFFVPRTFTAIAFDSGGVASGPLTATFMLPMAIGACEQLGGVSMTDAFGLVALVAMMPLITVQFMGLLFVLKSRRAKPAPAVHSYADNEIIELWEVV